MRCGTKGEAKENTEIRVSVIGLDWGELLNIHFSIHENCPMLLSRIDDYQVIFCQYHFLVLTQLIHKKALYVFGSQLNQIVTLETSGLIQMHVLSSGMVLVVSSE